MGQYTYYCEVQHPKVELPPGIYKVVADKAINERWFPQLNRAISLSHRVWKQGPKGGVKIVKDHTCWGMYPVGYITTNDEWMKKFTWVKLRARTLPV